MFRKINESFVKTIIFAFHIRVFHEYAKYMLVETTREVAL